MTRVTPSLQGEVEQAGFSWGTPVFIRLFKIESQLEVWLQDGATYRLFRTYPICTWSGDLGPKLQEGDGQSPEGFYSVPARMMNPTSTYHLSFNLGYPNKYDRSHGRTGSFLMVHGECVSIGCYAMATTWDPYKEDRNQPIEEIWTLMSAAFNAGQKDVPVHIFPFRMTDQNFSRAAAYTEWLDFWKNLRTGHDMFEQSHVPPKVSTANGLYVFE